VRPGRLTLAEKPPEHAFPSPPPRADPASPHPRSGPIFRRHAEDRESKSLARTTAGIGPLIRLARAGRGTSPTHSTAFEPICDPRSRSGAAGRSGAGLDGSKGAAGSTWGRGG